MTSDPYDPYRQNSLTQTRVSGGVSTGARGRSGRRVEDRAQNRDRLGAVPGPGPPVPRIITAQPQPALDTTPTAGLWPGRGDAAVPDPPPYEAANSLLGLLWER
jgi:hypothetical protein